MTQHEQDQEPQVQKPAGVSEACDVPVQWSCRIGVCHMCGLLDGRIMCVVNAWDYNTLVKEQKMKSKCSVLLSLVLMMPLASSAASKNSAKVTFDDTVTVGGTQVPAGNYRVQWEGTGTSVTARIMQGDKVIASAPAILVHVKSPYSDEAVSVGPGDNNSKVLQAIEWSHQSLQFDQTSGSLASTVGNTQK